MKTAFAPATVANVACGFDVLGLAIEEPGDLVTAELIVDDSSETTGKDELGRIDLEVEGDAGRLPREPERNTASVAARAFLDRFAPDASIRLRLQKGLPLASGMGSSAASAVAAVVAVNDLVGVEASLDDLLTCALEGERIAAGTAHADNAAACLYGGFVLVRGTAPALDVIRLPVPKELSVALVRPHLELSTRDARTLIGNEVRLHDAVTQWGNLGAFVAALYREDWDLMARSLVDVIAEPIRSHLVPGFAEVKHAALETGALGCSLSGSGPSMFALCRNRDMAEAVSRAMARAFADAAELETDVHVSPVSKEGARPEVASCAS